MSGRKKSKLVKILVWLFFLLLLVGGIGAIFHFSGIGKDDITDIVKPVFRIEYNGKSYQGDNNVFTLPKSGQARFVVKNCENCSIKVFPNVTEERDFTFTVYGQEHKYSEIKDLTTAFIKSNNLYSDGVALDCDQKYDLSSVLNRLYDGAEVTTVPYGDYLYRLVFTSDKNETISFLFGVDLKVTLSETAIYI